MPLNSYGKMEDTIDVGEEMDYSGFEWFKDVPAPREVRLRPFAALSFF